MLKMQQNYNQMKEERFALHMSHKNKNHPTLSRDIEQVVMRVCFFPLVCSMMKTEVTT